MQDYICATCNSPFRRYSSRMKQTKTPFCSRQCANNYTGGRQDVPCEICGTLIRRKQTLIKNRARHFCSRRCNGIWRSQHFQGSNNPHYQRGKVSFPCVQCGATTLLFPALINGRKYCSKACYRDWQAIHTNGPANFHWRGGYREYYGPNWHEQREKARERDDHICQACGRSERKLHRRLDVHHLQPFRTFEYTAGQNDAYLLANDLTNLISLCASCHKHVESGRITVQPKLI